MVFATMPYLLDTNHCSYLMNGLYKKESRCKPEEIKTIEAFNKITTDAVYMSEASIGEISYGAEISAHSTNIYQRLAKLKNIILAAPVDVQCWELFEKTKGELKLNGKKIQDIDLLIACVAHRYGCIFVTNDGAFKNLPAGFQVENWSS